VVAGPGLADPAEVTNVSAVQNGDAWRFSVTLLHGDTGWHDYADGWRVEAADGTVLGYRELFRTNVDGWDNQTTTFTLPR